MEPAAVKREISRSANSLSAPKDGEGETPPGSSLGRGRKGERGIALVAVLWVLILLSLIAATVATTTRSDLRIARNAAASAVAEAAADAAVHEAAAGLFAQQGRTGEWQTDGSPRIIQVGDCEVMVAVQDEGGKVDLNAAGRPLLEAVLPGTGEGGVQLAAAIVDWRDADDATTPGGAESRDYARLGLPYGAKNGAFDSVDELLQVAGVTPQLFTKVAPLLTVYSNSPGIDPSVAPREVLAAFPQLDPATVEVILSSRAAAAQAGPNAPVTLPPMSRQGSFTPSPRNAFAVTATARSPEGAVFVREAVVHLPRDGRTPYLLLSWRQGRTPAPPAGLR